MKSNTPKYLILFVAFFITSNTFAMRWIALQRGPALANLAQDVTWDNIGNVTSKVADGGKGENKLVEARDQRLAELRSQARERIERIERETAAKNQQRAVRMKEALEVINSQHATPEAKNTAARVLEALTQEEIEQDKAAQKRIAEWDESERTVASGIPALGNFVMDGVKRAQELEAQKVSDQEENNNASHSNSADSTSPFAMSSVPENIQMRQEMNPPLERTEVKQHNAETTTTEEKGKFE